MLFRLIVVCKGRFLLKTVAFCLKCYILAHKMAYFEESCPIFLHFTLLEAIRVLHTLYLDT